MSLACEEPGFEPVDVPDGRRGLWVRVERRDEEVAAVELVAGREGDDARVLLNAGETITPALLASLVDALDRLRFSREIADGRV